MRGDRNDIEELIVPNGRVSNGILPQSILKDSTTRPSLESRKVRHLSNESSSSARGVTFDKSLPCNALRGSQEEPEIRELNRNLRNRRTSLPVSTHSTFVQRTQHQSSVSEARGLIVDMLQNRDLSPNVVSCLRAVAQLLNQTTSVGFNFNELGLPTVVESTFGEQLTIPSASKPRVSNITFSTVTSATGLPTIAAEPSRPRSSNYWKPSASHHQDFPETGGHKTSISTSILHQHSVDSGAKASRRVPNQRHASDPAVTDNIGVLPLDDNVAVSVDVSSPKSDSSLSLNERRRSSGSSTAPQPIPIPSSAAYLSSTAPSPFAKSPSLIKSPSPSVAFSLHEEPEGGSGDEESKATSSTQPEGPHDDELEGAESTASLDVQVVQTADGTVFDRNEIERDGSLRRIIVYVTQFFRQSDLFSIFRISPVKFFNFFHALEAGYWDISYHNRIHATDVLHSCHYLTTHPVRAFLGRPSTPEDDDSEGVEPISFGPLLDSAPLPIANSMTPLELMALYTAAAAHDIDHPGRTNAFLVAAEDRKAILYNDRSVLENHHAAESWRLLCKPMNYFIETLDSAETKRFRYLVLEYILATDLKQHFDIILSFNDKSAEMDLTNESDRVLVSQMLIKFADINSPAKPFALHRQWTDRICEEFYEQGDEEKRRGMSISPYMDREQPAVAKLQDSFIAHIVNPLVMALNEAGLLPVLPGLEEPELIINLKHNHQKWLIEIEEQQEAEETEEEPQTSDDRPTVESNDTKKQCGNGKLQTANEEGKLNRLETSELEAKFWFMCSSSARRRARRIRLSEERRVIDW
ncbi:3'5'-cyclic nucleotide phosphodiesterase [Aphelenchoides besseyi]|nr:3'5'-cyclic nucleotide phosphodiesterase [Aphelenchoides besseyi]